MAKNEKNITLGVKANTKDAKGGLNDVIKEINQLKKSISNSGLTKLAISSTALVNSFAAVKGAISTVNAVVKDLTESYKIQANAEVQLENAANNNPYLNNTSVNNLKNFASEIQSFTTYGDEQLLPFMANLAAQGRTEAEIMDVMSAAVDLAAGSNMSLESAVKSLSGTLNGTTGELGKTNGAIKSLTKEQLKSGEAIRIIKEQYKGMAEQTALATGTSQQLQNAIGDLKEEFGAGFEEAAKPMRKFFTEFFSNWATYKKMQRVDKTDSDLDVEKAKLEELRQAYEDVRNDILLNEKTKEKARKKYEQQKILVDNLTKTLEEERKANEALAKVQQQENEEQEKQDIAQKALDTYNKTIETKLKQIEQDRKIAEIEGKNFDELKAQQEELDTRTKAYFKLLEDAQGTITGNAEREVAERQKILDLVEKTNREQALEVQKSQYEDLIGEIETLGNNQEQKQSELMQSYIDNLTVQHDAIINSEEYTAEQKLKVEQQFTDAKARLLDLQKRAVKEEAEAERQATFESAQNKIAIASEFVNVYAQTMSTLSNMVATAAKAEADSRIASLDNELKKGIISEEEYAEQKEEIEKESAEKQYKIQMWEWSASLLQIAVNTAQGITKAIAQGGIVGMALSGAIAALGAVQLAAAYVNKPVKPSFATGGIVGGTSYTGDKVQANVNSREMILTMRQQKNVFDAINSGKLGTKGGTNIKVYNSVSNLVKTQTQTDQNGDISLYISAMVKNGIASGEYNDALESANSKLGGVMYTN